MNNFEFEHNGKKLWYSRSLACNLIVFVRMPDKSISVLCNKRGQGCEFNKGKWNLPGGFIDFNEDSKDCAIRETFEECGVKIDKNRVIFSELLTKPHGKRQTMTAVHYAIYDYNTEAKNWTFDTNNSENGEVEEVKLIDYVDIVKTNSIKNEFVNGQVEVIHNIFNKHYKEICDLFD